MYKRKVSIIIVAVATAVLFGLGDAMARGGAGGGGGFHGAGGGGGAHGGSASLRGGGGGGWGGGGRGGGGPVPGRQGEFHGGNNVRPDHLRPNPPDNWINRRHDNTNDINTGNTYNVTTNGDWDGYGAADEAMAGMMFATTLGMVARSASQQQQQSSPSTVVVEQPAPVVVVNNQQPGPSAPAPVIGSQIVTLPAGAQSQTVNGMLFYTCGSAWYKPYFGTSGVYYETVPPPGQ